MRNKITLLLILTFCSLKAQQIVDIHNYYTDDTSSAAITNLKYYKDLNNCFAPLIGTWLYQVGNQTFVLTFIKQAKVPIGSPTKFYIDSIYGHYKMVENYGLPNETIIYTSNKNFRGTSQQIRYAIDPSCSSTYGNFSGAIFDFSHPDNSSQYGLMGYLSIEIDTLTIPTIAQWRIKALQGIRGETPIFNIPVNAILTKLP